MPVIAVTNCHGPDGAEPRFVAAGDLIPDSWRVQVGAEKDYVEALIASGGAKKQRKSTKQED